MKVIVTGDRSWVTDADIMVVYARLSLFPAGTVLIHGACTGVDTIADVIGRTELGFVVRPYPADWDKYKRAAGPIRNREMLTVENVPEEPVDLVLGFHYDIASSKGTRDMLNVGALGGVTTELFDGVRSVPWTIELVKSFKKPSTRRRSSSGR